ncbi:MAG: hypothetical protein ACD_46C00219G0003 [uncultured bacterium]|nr:MAG: hypothetical protein ACD_46C00219G0003 [uncultured bacterium]
MNGNNQLILVRLGIDTHHEFVVYMNVDCYVCKLEGFEAQTQIVVSLNGRSIVASLNVIHTNILGTHEASLSEDAWTSLGAKAGDIVQLSHLPPVISHRYVRSKIHGNAISPYEFDVIITDMVDGKYTNAHIASFITACAHDNLSINEIISLTKSMIKSGEQLKWNQPIIVDKHSVGGIPGNRTTPIVVPIVAAAGLTIPKTSSRSITSPAGTADTVETFTNVTLSIEKMREVVAKENGCMVWGGTLKLSPADDIIIRVERLLDLDPEGQMIASVLSKKAAVGATHVVIDIPVGPSAKIRSDQAFLKLKEYFVIVGKAIGIHVDVVRSNGDQPVGTGIGPSLEAKDILAVLNNDPLAPEDLRTKAILLAGRILEFSDIIPFGKGETIATNLLENGMALKKFMAICNAQGGFQQPTTAAYQYDVLASYAGTVTIIDNRSLAKVAKLAGAPHDRAAGIEFFAKLGSYVQKDQLLYRIHAESQGALNYALAYIQMMPNIIIIS